MIDERARLIAAFVFTDLVGAWLWFSFRAAREQSSDGDSDGAPVPVPRPRIGLHDDPQRVIAEASSRKEADRRGSPPPLR